MNRTVECFQIWISIQKPGTNCRNASAAGKLCSCHSLCLPKSGGACGKECVSGVHGAPHQSVPCLGCLGARPRHPRVQTTATPVPACTDILGYRCTHWICDLENIWFPCFYDLGSLKLGQSLASSLLKSGALPSLRRDRALEHCHCLAAGIRTILCLSRKRRSILEMSGRWPRLRRSAFDLIWSPNIQMADCHHGS